MGNKKTIIIIDEEDANYLATFLEVIGYDARGYFNVEDCAELERGDF